MRVIFPILLFVQIVIAGLLLSSCGSDSTTAPGTFPNFGTLSKAVAPLLKTSSSSGIPFKGMMMYDVGATNWNTYNAYGKLKDVLGDPDEDPKVVTKLHILIASLQTYIDTINSTYSKSDGTLTGCTQVPAGTTVKSPWLTNKPPQSTLFSFSEVDAYQCVVDIASGTSPHTTAGKLLFGRNAISSPSAGCTDAFTYNFLVADSGSAVNTESVSERGSTVRRYNSRKAQYNGCTKDFTITYVQSTVYATGVEFTSRSDLTGNTSTHLFTLRSLKYDRTSGGTATYFNVKGYGKSQAATGSEYFLIQYLNTGSSIHDDWCVTATTSGSNRYSYTPVAATGMGTGQSGNASCTALETTFLTISDLATTDLPIVNGSSSAPFTVDAADFGL